MFTVINKQILARNVKRIDIVAEAVAQKACPGQFVLVVPGKDSGWVPLSVVESDASRGTLSFIFQERGPVTKRLGALAIHEKIFAVMGPMGKPATVKAAGTVVCAASGVGIASLLPICRALRRAENKVVGVIGAPTKDLLLMEPQMRLACHKLMITTEDGSRERRGSVADLVKAVLSKEKVKLVYAIGPAAMMEEVCQLTRPGRIETLIQANTVMYCGSGLCGSCRLDVDGRAVLSCCQGPEFDGHDVDFDKLKIRLNTREKAQRLLDIGDVGQGGLARKLLSGLWGE